ncbi:MAG: hypothetical protein LQ350_004299 [Teloschistes chrysophthalmus]|nr:MAG: hypothetical protein LQ350_004299 [Niorma chrysophthalma]
MGVFGSLSLAYKYAIILGSLFTVVIIAGLCKVLYDKRRLKKHVEKANLEAAGGTAQEERVELNQRDPDEGDLFGIRAIQSGFFGGVAQSRPASIAESNSPDGSSSNTLLGSRHASPKIGAQSPMSSVTTLPLEARRSSPLAHKAMSSEDLHAPTTPQRRVPTALRTTLRPSDAELNGRVNHDPAVNMLLDYPPSPRATSRPTTTYMDPHDRTPSGYFPASHNGGQYAPLGAPQIPEQVRRSSSRPISVVPSYHPEPSYHSQSASIVSGTSDRYTPDGRQSPNVTDPGYIKVPPNAASEERRRGSDSSEERPRSRGREEWVRPARSHPPRTSSRYSNFPQMPTIHSQSQEDEAATRQSVPSNAVGGWGHEVFQEFHQSVHGSTLAVTPPNSKYNHHTSTLSDASSTFSSAPVGHRDSGRQISIESKMQLQPRQSAGPEANFDSATSAAGRGGTRRESDASSRDVNSSDQSNAGSHRNTKEFGDFYDSYWRRSGQAQAIGQQGNPHWRPTDSTRDCRRAGPKELKPSTIAEVPSPAPSPGIGKAM